MADRLIYEDTDKRIYVIAEETADTPQQERVEWANPFEQAVRDRAADALADLRQITGSSGTLTAAQLSGAVRVLARVCIALVRLVLRRLDADG